MKKFLWISDIHLNGPDITENTISLINAFHLKLKEFNDIEILIISGDVAYSGGEEKHYSKFKELIIDPIRARFPQIKIVSVPGNHDVDWKEAKSKFIDAIINNESPGEEFNEFRKKIGANYYKKVFQEYKDFHFYNADNKAPNTFSNIFEHENFVFVSFNSAWLSVGSPTQEVNYNFKEINGVISYEFWKSDPKSKVKKIIFQEHGNQTYGFTLKNIKTQIAKLKKQLINEYSDSIKILVAHHPPNNWLNWNELYSGHNNDKSDFNKFIVEANIDIILSGHEHTSLIEGGLLFGRSLDLKGGMFLDHHQKKYHECWFKLIELSDTKLLKERWFNYHPGNKFWKESREYGKEYKNWTQICRPLEINNAELNKNVQYQSKDEFDDNSSKREFDLKSIINSAKINGNLFEQVTNLVGLNVKVKFEKLSKGIYKHNVKKENQHTIVYIIDNIDDYFSVNLDKIPENSYLKSLLTDLGTDNLDADIFIFYTYSIKSEELISNSRQIEKLIRKKSEHFRDIIFRYSVCIERIKNAKFAVRMVK